MSETSPGDVTRLLKQWSDGDQEALPRLMPLVHDELASLASAYLRRERPDHTLETSALVNEAYLRLVDLKQVGSRSRTHFLGLAARIFRNILVDHARNQLAVKRGAGVPLLSLDQAFTVSVKQAPALVALDDALKSLGTLHPQEARIVELHCFGGLTFDEIAEVLETSRSTAARGWRIARAWLYSCLSEEDPV